MKSARRPQLFAMVEVIGPILCLRHFSIFPAILRACANSQVWRDDIRRVSGGYFTIMTQFDRRRPFSTCSVFIFEAFPISEIPKAIVPGSRRVIALEVGYTVSRAYFHGHVLPLHTLLSIKMQTGGYSPPCSPFCLGGSRHDRDLSDVVEYLVRQLAAHWNVSETENNWDTQEVGKIEPFPNPRQSNAWMQIDYPMMGPKGQNHVWYPYTLWRRRHPFCRAMLVN